ncbi:hypothetical protein ACFPRL_28090 [Pseudoclavibacter helvolus]
MARLNRVTCFPPAGFEPRSQRPAPRISEAVIAATAPIPIAVNQVQLSASPSCQMSDVIIAKTPAARAAVRALESPMASRHG